MVLSLSCLLSHPIGKDARAIWVGSDLDVEELREKWPCPNRVVSISSVQLDTPDSCQKPSSVGLAEELNNMLGEVMALNDGANRWACTRREWDVDFDSFDGHMWVAH